MRFGEQEFVQVHVVAGGGKLRRWKLRGGWASRQRVLLGEDLLSDCIPAIPPPAPPPPDSETAAANLGDDPAGENATAAAATATVENDTDTPDSPTAAAVDWGLGQRAPPGFSGRRRASQDSQSGVLQAGEIRRPGRQGQQGEQGSQRGAVDRNSNPVPVEHTFWVTLNGGKGPRVVLCPRTAREKYQWVGCLRAHYKSHRKQQQQAEHAAAAAAAAIAAAASAATAGLADTGGKQTKAMKQQVVREQQAAAANEEAAQQAAAVGRAEQMLRKLGQVGSGASAADDAQLLVDEAA